MASFFWATHENGKQMLINLDNVEAVVDRQDGKTVEVTLSPRTGTFGILGTFTSVKDATEAALRNGGITKIG